MNLSFNPIPDLEQSSHCNNILNMIIKKTKEVKTINPKKKLYVLLERNIFDFLNTTVKSKNLL